MNLSTEVKQEVVFFEGFSNFLSFYPLYHKGEEDLHNLFVLNSTSFFEKSLPLMQWSNSIHLYLEGDKTGEKFIRFPIGLDKEEFTDKRRLYQKVF